MQEVTSKQGKNSLKSIDLCIDNILKCKTLNEILNRDISMFENGEDNFNSFLFNDIKTYAVLDLLYKDNLTGIYIIVDWKTSDSYDTTDRQQQLLYAIYVMNKHNIGINEIVCRCEYLRSGSFNEFNFNDMDIATFSLKFHNMIDCINNYLDNVDLNIPKKSDTFIPTTNLQVCSLCCYKQICESYSLNIEKHTLCENT